MSFAPLLRKQELAAPNGSFRIGEPNDAFEREADRVAEEVMSGGRIQWSPSSMSFGHPVQRKCSCGGSGECEDCKEKGALQRKAANSAAPRTAPPIVNEVLRSPGRPLDPATRAFFETRFGHDFSQVRVHTGPQAAESAGAAEALAYTAGHHVVFGAGQYSPNSARGRKLLAHELAHTVQQLGSQSSRAAALPTGATLQRQAGQAKGAKAEFSGCDPKMQDDLRDKQGPALDHVRRAIQALANGWKKMNPADQSVFRQYFDPAGTGDIDEGFVSDVRGNYRRILGYMSSLSFDCDPTSKTLCGSGGKWCVGGRLMWTCFGALHVCPDAYSKADEPFKIETMIHESVHNALHTTDREYATSKEFSRLKPRGSGILSFLSKIPIIGAIFRLFRSNNDTLNNPDSYARFAMDV
jgi:Domain of unknown function (DUF4157)